MIHSNKQHGFHSVIINRELIMITNDHEITRNRYKKILLIVAGTISTILGIIGIFVPILPTTPFLLLAAACYARSSKRFYTWLLDNKFFGSYIRNYLEKRGTTLKIKIFTLTLLWFTIGCSILFAIESIAITIALLCIAVGVTIHIVRLNTIE